MQRRKILIVDDERSTVDSLDLLLGEDFDLSVASTGEEALERIQSTPVDLVFLDITLPGLNGFEALSSIKRYDDSIEVVMLTADERVRTAMRAMELGAFHYITKPYDKDDILLVTRRVFEKKCMSEEIVALRDDLERLESFHDMVGQSPAMKEIYKLVEKVAETDTTVMITGESGTGKELVARAIHAQSDRRHKHFKAVNCGAIPEHLLESELFGHEKGSFTGASERKIGKFEMANGGTLFLDEISTMKETLQVKLLRVLQEHEIERVGGIKAIPIDVRIISATNSNLRKLVEKCLFREDLYYRLNVIHLPMPPLRERKVDIALLAEYFLKFFSKKFNKPVKRFTDDANRVMQEYSWPGNVRELKNVIERAVVLSDRDEVGIESLPFDLSVPSHDFSETSDLFSLRDIMDHYEKKVLLNTLERVAWNQTKAAETLGIHRNTLLQKLDSLGIEVTALKRELKKSL